MLLIIPPLVAVGVLVVTVTVWHRALTPEPSTRIVRPSTSTSPETFSGGLEEHLRELMASQGIEDRLIRIGRPDSSLAGISRMFTVRVPANRSLTRMNVLISRMVDGMGGAVYQAIEDVDSRSITIEVGAGPVPTDLIVLRFMPEPTAASATMAIIIDDLGIRTLDSAQRFIALNQAVTLSILPFQRHTEQVIDLARASGATYMLHMPMEPISANENPGEGAVYADDTSDTITNKLARAFNNVDGAVGMNNHMGSKATEDLHTMEIVMGYLEQHGYFFVDSQTSRNSQGYAVSQRMGVKSAKLTGFLDVEDDSSYIADRLDQYARQALDGGTVLVIGHDRPTTLKVLEAKLPELEEQGITFIPATEIVR